MPAAGVPTFDVGPSKIEMGVGIHGEPGRRRQLIKPAVLLQRTHVCNIATSLEMAGASLTLTMLDDELCGYWDAPVRTAALSW